MCADDYLKIFESCKFSFLDNLLQGNVCECSVGFSELWTAAVRESNDNKCDCAGGGREAYCNTTKQIGNAYNCFNLDALLTLLKTVY